MQTESTDFKRLTVWNWQLAGSKPPDEQKHVLFYLYRRTDYVAWNSVNQLRTFMITAMENSFSSDELADATPLNCHVPNSVGKAG